MLNFPITQDTKKTIVDARGNEIVDFLEKDISTTIENIPLEIENFYVVKTDTEIRPDLCASQMYGYLDSIEMVLKFNFISNPFEIEEGDVLFVWSENSITKASRNSDTRVQDIESIRKQYLTPEKKPNVDLKLLEYQNKLKESDSSKLGLPPNFASEGDREIEVKGNKIIFGPNVTRCPKETSKPLSKSEYISKLIKNRISWNI